MMKNSWCPAMRFVHLSAIILMCAAFAAKASAGEKDETDNAEFQRWIEYYQEVARQYDFRLRDDPETKLKIAPKPLLSYAQPFADTELHGAFFVWTRRGRPEVIGSIWSDGQGDGSRNVMHEFHSLALGPLAPVRVGRGTWSPAAGIELRPIPGAEAPKNSAALRLAQMRTLARQFTGFSTPHGRELRLRTLDQPLFRYQSELPEVLDGAVFGMFADWDPDIMLLIEARRVGDESQWLYGIGRFNGCPLRLEHNGTEVWNEGLVPLRKPKSNFYAALVGAHRISPATPR